VSYLWGHVYIVHRVRKRRQSKEEVGDQMRRAGRLEVALSAESTRRALASISVWHALIPIAATYRSGTTTSAPMIKSTARPFSSAAAHAAAASPPHGSADTAARPRPPGCKTGPAPRTAPGPFTSE